MNNNTLKRVVTSLFLVPIILLLIYLEGLYFFALLFFIMLIGTYEAIKLNFFTIKLIILSILISFVYCSYEIIKLDNGKYIIFYIILLTCSSDIGGYLFGRLIGGKKINFISPNKTYVGFLGSLFTAQFIIFFSAFLNITYLNNLFFNYIFIFICTIIVIFGDLLFSFFKRKCGIKDYSNIIPGHGGLLDRIDGLMVLTIFIFIFTK